eukprot:Opistho-2@52114
MGRSTLLQEHVQSALAGLQARFELPRAFDCSLLSALGAHKQLLVGVVCTNFALQLRANISNGGVEMHPGSTCLLNGRVGALPQNCTLALQHFDGCCEATASLGVRLFDCVLHCLEGDEQLALSRLFLRQVRHLAMQALFAGTQNVLLGTEVCERHLRFAHLLARADELGCRALNGALVLDHRCRKLRVLCAECPQFLHLGGGGGGTVLQPLLGVLHLLFQSRALEPQFRRLDPNGFRRFLGYLFILLALSAVKLKRGAKCGKEFAAFRGHSTRRLAHGAGTWASVGTRFGGGGGGGICNRRHPRTTTKETGGSCGGGRAGRRIHAGCLDEEHTVHVALADNCADHFLLPRTGVTHLIQLARRRLEAAFQLL